MRFRKNNEENNMAMIKARERQKQKKLAQIKEKRKLMGEVLDREAYTKMIMGVTNKNAIRGHVRISISRPIESISENSGTKVMKKW